MLNPDFYALMLSILTVSHFKRAEILYLQAYLVWYDNIFRVRYL